MRIRLQGLPRENEHALDLIATLFEILDDSGDRVPRSRSHLRHRHLTVNFTRPARPGRRA